MDFLREIVGGPKNRYKEFGYNLDLTYITNRVIAMAFPASGIQKLYRNSVDSIREFLENAHQNKYITINISGRDIQGDKLQNVSTYDWQDHKAPSFEVLFIICDQVAAFLAQDIDRIAVFHCNHGKGRTGTIICCFNLYLGLFKQTKQAMKFYANQRFATDGYGVTQPCQIRYIEYFKTVLDNPDYYPKVIAMKSIELRGDFSFNQPYVKIYRLGGRQLVYNSKLEGAKFTKNEDGLMLKVKQVLALAGDIVIELKESKSIGKNLLISYTFNTAFLGKDQQWEVPLQKLSPLGKQKLDNFGQSFYLFISIQNPLCLCGQNKKTFGCNLCHGAMKGQTDKWNLIHSILKVKLKNMKRRASFAAKGKQLTQGNNN